MAERTVRTLGGLRLDPYVHLPTPGRLLVVYLALHNISIERRSLVESLWPELDTHHGRARLRRALWVTPREWAVARGDELWLDARVDLDEGRALAFRAIRGEQLTLDEIVTLSVDVLPGWTEEWVVEVQDDYHQLRVRALEAACRTLVDHGMASRAIPAGVAAVTAEPLRETAAAALISAHLAEGNRYDALRRYRTLCELLRRELGVEPDRALTERLLSVGLLNGNATGTHRPRSGNAGAVASDTRKALAPS